MIGRHVAAATLCAAVALLAPNSGNSLPFVPCGTSSDHYVLVEKVDQHVVKPGETLWGISASDFGDPTKYSQLAARSGISNPHLIFPGQTVLIPRGESYEFVGRRESISGTGFCPITNTSGFQYLGAFYHPKGTTIKDITPMNCPSNGG